MNIRKIQQRLTCIATAAALSFLAAQAGAAPLALVDSPLFLSTGVEPNLIMAIDDSSSMDFELLLRGNDGAGWWRTTNNASGNCTAATGGGFTGCVADGATDQPGAGQLNFNNAGNSSGTWKKFAYLFPNGSGGNTSDQRRNTDSTNDHYAIAPLPAYAWSRSAEFNTAYFNPNVAYQPWPNGGGYTFTNSPAATARFDPVYTGAGTINLTRDFAGNAGVDTGTSCDATTNAVAANFYFRVYTGMVIPAGTCMRVSTRANWETVRATGTCTVGTTNGCLMRRNGVDVAAYTLANDASVAFRYYPATFYASSTNPPPASFGYTGTAAAVGKAPDGSTLNRYEIKSGNFAVAADYTAAIQNFANWFTYFRKRHQALRSGLGQAFQSLTATRVAGFTINQAGSSATSPDVTVADVGIAANRTALYTNFYYNWTGGGGTPNRAGVANVIRNFKRTGANAPITHSCQRNFGMLFTDGFSNPPAGGDGMPAGNIDGGKGDPYQDGVSNTMADGVMASYATTLRSDITQGKVTVPTACKDPGHDLRLDCNTNPHMNFYAITLGTRGLLFNPDAPTDPYVTAPVWPTTFPARHPSAVDDLWHATINGRGQLLNAKSSSELADKLGAVLKSIAESVGSAASASVNSGSINADTRLFQASFDSKDWSGKLEAVEINTNGTLGTLTLATIPAAGSRQIITMNSDGATVPFRWADLDATRRTELDATATDTTGANLVNYLRGEATNEAPAGAGYRARKVTKLGDIIDSSPQFVGAPSLHYPDSLEAKPYSKFRSDNINRDHTVYVGANDGMLHAFHAEDAVGSSKAVSELFAYVPSTVFKNLKLLSAPNYVHQFYVDGTPTTGDAFVGGEWRTMLAAGLNKGGQAIYALDVTNASAIKESSADGVLHWEFDDSKDQDLGYTYSRPAIVRMKSGKWAAVFGNGYNNTVADDHVSTTGDAVLYVVDLETGELIKKIDTDFGSAKDPNGTSRPNGLSSPVVIDTNGDSIADLAYAGDLFGNLWKFDVSSADPADWKVSYDNSGPVPLFVTKTGDGKPQAITSRPNVSRGPRGRGLLIVVGTGKYLETGDNDVASLKPQTFYGLLDPNTGDRATDTIASRDNLTPQTITNEVLGATFGAGTAADPQVVADVRVTSDNTVAEDSRGWYLDLVSPSGFQGEMQVTDSIIRNGHVIFTTLVPNADPCENGGTSWLMEMNLFTGARLDNSPFDLNNNGLFDDKVKVGGKDLPVSGVRSTVGIEPKGGMVSGEKCDYIIFPGTSGGTETRCRDPGARGFGRQSWRQSK